MGMQYQEEGIVRVCLYLAKYHGLSYAYYSIEVGESNKFIFPILALDIELEKEYILVIWEN